MLGKLTDKGTRISTPNLASRDKSAWWDNRVGEEHSSALDASALSNDWVRSDHAVIVNDAAVDGASSFNDYILSNVAGAGNAGWKSVGSVDVSAVTNGSEVTDANGVQFSTDGHIVPDSSPFADDDLAQKSGIWGDPSIINLWDGVVKRHALAMTGWFLEIGDILCEVASNTIKFYQSKDND